MNCVNRLAKTQGERSIPALAALVCMTLLLVCGGAFAQPKKPAPAGKPKAGVQNRQPAASGKTQQAEAEEKEVAKLARYESLGRRDPFQNLANLQVKPSAPKIIAPPPLARRPPGLSGLLISEVSVIGMASKAEKSLVVLRGTDKFTYMAQEGTQLYDGYVEAVREGEVTFVREVRDTAGNTITSKVVKR